jgi:hypothetical protein
VYYAGLALVFIVIFLWKRDMKKVKEAHMLLKEALKRERSDLESLKEKYMALLNKETNKETNQKTNQKTTTKKTTTKETTN